LGKGNGILKVFIGGDDTLGEIFGLLRRSHGVMASKDRGKDSG